MAKRRDRVTETPEHLWDRQPGETMPNYRLFTAFLSMKKRSLVRLADTENETIGERMPGYDMLRVLSSKHSWFKRAEAWDAQQIERQRERLEKERLDRVAKAERSHEKAGAALQEMGLGSVSSRVKRHKRLSTKHAKLVQEGKAAEAEEVEELLAEQISAGEAISAVKEGVQLERLGLRMPTRYTHVEVRQEKLKEEEIERICAAASREEMAAMASGDMDVILAVSQRASISLTLH